MIFETKTVHLKTGEEAIFRAPQEADAESQGEEVTSHD